MKSRFLQIQLVFIMAILLLLTGCVPKVISNPVAPEVNASNSAEVADSSIPVHNSSVAPDAPTECNWTMYVDQTIPVTQDGVIVNYTLLLIAQKTGGLDVNGTYKGAAYIGCNFDASQMNTGVMELLGGFEMNAFTYDLNFEIIPYDIEAFSEYGLKEGEAPLAPLVQYESMVLISPEMSGDATLNPNVGVQGEHVEVNESAAGTEPVAMKITIQSGKVRVSIPSFDMGSSFEGSLTGEPLQNGQDDQIALAIDKIELIIDENKSAEDSGSGSGGLGDILNQFMPN